MGRLLFSWICLFFCVILLLASALSAQVDPVVAAQAPVAGVGHTTLG